MVNLASLEDRDHKLNIILPWQNCVLSVKARDNQSPLAPGALG